MKKNILLFLLLGFMGTMSMQAQTRTVRLGVKGGANLSDFSFKSDNFKSDNSLGFFVGPIIHVNLPSTGLGINVAALYNHHKVKVNDTETIKHQSLLVPLNLRYSLGLGGTTSFFVEAGPQIAFTLGDRSLKWRDNDLGDVDWRFNNSDLSANIGGGVVIGPVQLSVNYNLPFGKTGEFEWTRATEEKLLHATSKEKTWQISAALFF